MTFHDRPGPYGLANGAKRAIAVDWTGLPLVARVVAVSTVEQVAAGQSDRLGLVMAVRGTLVKAARELSAKHRCEVRRVVWDEPQLDGHERKVFRPIAHAWRVKVAHGTLGWSDGLSKSFENTTRTATGGCNSHARSPGTTCCADWCNTSDGCCVTPFANNDKARVRRQAKTTGSMFSCRTPVTPWCATWRSGSQPT